MCRLIHRSSVMTALVRLADRFAETARPVLILGEPGTGKELLARRIHEKSPRKGRVFNPIDCTTLGEQVAESELFGHEKGAFTGAETARLGAIRAAKGGTVFLDEIGELPTALQPKLLRFLEEGEVRVVGADRPVKVDVRVVAATNRDLPAAVARGEFRADLLDRLKVHVLDVPPLRDRGEDVLLLAEKFLEADSGGNQTFSHNAKAMLLMHSWKGNVRELRNLVGDVAARTKQKSITEQHLRARLPQELPQVALRDARKLKVFQFLGKVSAGRGADFAVATRKEIELAMGAADSSVRDVLKDMVADRTLLAISSETDDMVSYQISPDFLAALGRSSGARSDPEILTATGQWKPFTKLETFELVHPLGPGTIRYPKNDDE